MSITFYLVPDIYSAHYIRKELTQHASLIGVQVGTWHELLELARNSYCLPELEDEWSEKLAAEIAKVKNAFWTKSLAFDPDATTAIVSDTLYDLLGAIGPGSAPFSKDKKESKRGRIHIKDLLSLHKKMGEALPVDFALIKTLLATPGKQAIRFIRLCPAPDILVTNEWQRALAQRLNDDYNSAHKSSDTTIEQRFKEAVSWHPPKKGKSGLSHLQRNLFAGSATKQKNRSGLQWLAVRDYRQEIELAAGMVQTIMANSGVKANEFALLLPNSSDYTMAAKEIFEKSGIPLSGLTLTSSGYNHASELIYNFLLCRQTAAPPTMLLAALFGSPLLPWAETGIEIAQQIMDGTWLSSIIENLPANHQKTGRFLSGKQIVEATRLIKALRGMAAIISNGDDLKEQRQIALSMIQELLRHIDEDSEIDWDTLLRISRPCVISRHEQTDINLEGVRVFHPEREPWQAVKHLLVLGFSEGAYPQTPPLFPVIPEEDRLCLAKKITLPTRQAILDRRRQRFCRQLCSASKSITFFMTMPPSSSLGFMSQLFSGVKSGEKLVLNTMIHQDRQRINNLAVVPEELPIPPRDIIAKDLKLGDNLLTKRKNSEGKTAPESPSGLEKMMISPLAWLMSRYSISSHEWYPAGLDSMIIGSIAHEIFERLFCHNSALPQKGRIKRKIEALFKQVVQDDFPFLIQKEWQVECRQMIKQFTEAAVCWLEFLNDNSLEILGEETWLAG